MKTRDWVLAIVVVLLSFLLFQQGCNNHAHVGKKDTTVINFYHYDSTQHHYHFKTVVPKDSIVLNIPSNVDTAAILRKYFTAYSYNDTIADSNMVAVIKETISQNKVQNRDFTYKWKRPVQITQVIHSENKDKLFVGIHGSYNATNTLSLGPEVLYVTKTDRAYKLNADLVNKGISAGIHWKLSFKKQ